MLLKNTRGHVFIQKTLFLTIYDIDEILNKDEKDTSYIKNKEEEV